MKVASLLFLLLFPLLLCAQQLTDIHPVSPQTRYLLAPQWSPDGRLYCSTPKYADIIEINLEDGSLRPIASGQGVGFKFTFAPDGSIFFKEVTDGGRNLWIIDTAGNKTLLAFDTEIGLPAWYNGAIRARFTKGVLSWNQSGDALEGSADGWVFQDGGGIFHYREGLESQRLSPGNVDCCLPAQSPDGSLVVYEGMNVLMLINLETGASKSFGPGNNAVWSPHGSFFLFDQTSDDGHRLVSGDIYYVARDAESRDNLTEEFAGIATHPAISPDATQVAFEASGRIYIGDLAR
ncbi:hypothetical protein KKA00_12925 [bacterium]|nr:hypothetical protein [bacterium]MBU1653119.1 hypothetical protein [bacterium]MBU1881801.1 hypothetical protein [bacterium]